MFKGLKIGVAVTGSFCSLNKLFNVLKELKDNNADIYIITTKEVQFFDTRFYNHDKLIKDLEEYTNHNIVKDIVDAELFGPKIKLDLLLVMPATSNTISKIAYGICDNPVIMAVKATLRNQKPVVIGMFTNDALGNSGQSWIRLMNTKHIYFIPFGQDDYVNKPNSLICDYKLALPTVINAFIGKQIQPVLIAYD